MHINIIYKHNVMQLTAKRWRTCIHNVLSPIRLLYTFNMMGTMVKPVSFYIKHRKYQADVTTLLYKLRTCMYIYTSLVEYCRKKIKKSPTSIVTRPGRCPRWCCCVCVCVKILYVYNVCMDIKYSIVSMRTYQRRNERERLHGRRWDKTDDVQRSHYERNFMRDRRRDDAHAALVLCPEYVPLVDIPREEASHSISPVKIAKLFCDNKSKTSLHSRLTIIFIGIRNFYSEKRCMQHTQFIYMRSPSISLETLHISCIEYLKWLYTR